jgi:hypothetical protein
MLQAAKRAGAAFAGAQLPTPIWTSEVGLA